uniref:Uncharacterized protein n=1 Tax=viral metagenome TaxID=1070528 RepID=A0A6M3J9U2_9ZZZZ
MRCFDDRNEQYAIVVRVRLLSPFFYETTMTQLPILADIDVFINIAAFIAYWHDHFPVLCGLSYM